jgi:hypothetical protein
MLTLQEPSYIFSAARVTHRKVQHMATMTRSVALSAQNQSAAVDQVRVRVLPDGRMTREDAARYLGLKSKTLAMWALQNKGPASVLVGGRRFYYQRVLDAFIAGEGV